MTIHEFEDPIAVETPLGKGLAIFVETVPHDAYWTVVIIETRAIVTFKQKKIRFGRSYSHELGIDNDQMKEITKC
jgi:hypothetical protein